MDWNPGIYNKFKSERFEPFFDLTKLIIAKPEMEVVDLGCGTGELTGKLGELLPDAHLLGVDSSPNMLQDSIPFANERVKFEQKSIEEQLDSDKKWDLIFSNAAIQWLDNHLELIPNIISHIKPGGQLAIQIPNQPRNTTNILLDQLAGQIPFDIALNSWKRTSPVLDVDSYAKLLFKSGGQSIKVFEKIYPIVVPDSEAIFDWVSGTALLPYLAKLPEADRPDFIARYKSVLKTEFPDSPAFYPFKRILMVANF